MNTSDKQLLVELQKKKTNHILHLLLSIITAGVWIIPWIIISIVNVGKNSALNDSLKPQASDKKNRETGIVIYVVIAVISIMLVISANQ